jgi:hypothetical protein
MEASILKTVAQIAGIGGIALGVLLIIFRNIIRKNIFPKFKNEEAYKIIRLIIILTFAIAALGIISWVYVSTIPKPQPDPKKAQVKIDDLIVSSKGGNSYFADFRVRNAGNTSVSLNRVLFKVSAAVYPSGCTTSPLNLSEKYDLDISRLEKVGDVSEVTISHSLAPEEIDRFGITLFAKHKKKCDYTLTLEPLLSTSEGDVSGKPFEVFFR